MKIGYCGIACKRFPKMTKGICPNWESGCDPKANPYCSISSYAFTQGLSLCFECPDFPCEVTKTGPISYGYCEYPAGKG